MEANKMIKQTKFGWVDLSQLSKNKSGTINWRKSIGRQIEFQYQDVHSYMIILEHINEYSVKIKIPNYVDEFLICTSSILCGKLGVAVSKIARDFIYQQGDVIDSLLILSMYRLNGRKYYNYKCLNDGYEGRISESDLQRGRRCCVCSGQVVMCGVNDTATTHPDIASLFWNQEDAKNYTAYSTKSADFRCPRCGSKISATIYNVTIQGLSCKSCGDGFSYPEKFVFNVLKQVFKLRSNVVNENNFETQKTFDWSMNILHDNPKLSGDKIYDFYVSMYDGVLIETHGLQHFEQCLYHTRQKDKTLEEEQENDRIKYNTAICNGVLPENYIVLDCRRSTVEHIKNSIMSSSLPQLLNFTEDQIDWNECGLFAMSSRIIEACILWNSGMHSTDQIGKAMKINRNTIRNYLRRGEELGIVQDPPKHYKKKTQQND